MPDITLAEAETHLAVWLAADLVVASGQSYTMNTPGGSRTLNRVDSPEIRANIAHWRGEVSRLTPGGRGTGIRLRGITPG